MEIAHLEIKLREAQARQSRAVATLAPKHSGGEIEEFRASCEAVLQAERNLAAEKGEEYAVPMEFPVSWDEGAPLPHLLQSDYRTFLSFYLQDVDPGWDGANVGVRDPSDPFVEPIALVEFERCICTKMGDPNVEVLRGHALSGKGLAAYQAMSVKNSAWLKEVEDINAVHSWYKAELWRDFSHYILPFHDSTFECIARGFKVEVLRLPLSDLLAEVCRRLIDQPA